MTEKAGILVVDDDPCARKSLCDTLGEKRWGPLPAATGREALEKVEEEAPAAALSDIVLEDMSGSSPWGSWPRAWPMRSTIP